MPEHSHYLIIGAGIAGLTAATSIRSQDKKSSLTLINGEPYAPYKRTNLSKFLASGFSAEDFTLATADDLGKYYGIRLLHERISAVDYRNKAAHSESSETKAHSYSYDYLILATGARYVLPPALQQQTGICFYHNKQNTFALQKQLRYAERIVVLGAGVQGLETCYELLKLGKQVRLIDSHEEPLSRLKALYISTYLKQDLAQQQVECLWQHRVRGADDSVLRGADLVICCSGTRPVNELFPPDASLQNNLLIAADVFACGDNWEYPDHSGCCSLWHEAMDLGQLAGLNAVRLARGTDAAELPDFKRKAYRIKMEVAGKVLFLAPPLASAAECGITGRHFLLNETTGNYYQFFLDRDEKLVGASLLCDNRDLLKPLQLAIWQKLSAAEALAKLGIPVRSEFDGNFAR